MINIKNLMKKEKTYPMTNLGRVQMDFDIKKKKESKVNDVVSVAVIVGMVGLGFLGKDIAIMFLVSKGLGSAANLIVG